MFEQYIHLLEKFVAFKSVSTDPKFARELTQAATWLQQLFTKNHFEAKVISGYHHPIVLAKYNYQKDAETVLIYGHYDVQPSDKEDGWKDEPFKLIKRNGRYYARGVMDDKGQILTHIVTSIDLAKAKKLKKNLIFLIEGAEEIGSTGIEKFVKENRDKLKADYVLISDGPKLANLPTMEISYRGNLNIELTLITAKNDVHSGKYGGTIPNASYEMSKLLSKLIVDNKINIPGFYDKIDEIHSLIKTKLLLPKFDFEELQKDIGVKKAFWEEGLNFYLQKGLRPSLEITGLSSGYTKEGFRNAIPSRASAKLNFRLVKGQKCENIAKLFKQFVLVNLPSYVESRIELDQGGVDAVKLDQDNQYFKRARMILTKVHSQGPVLNPVGGTIPIAKIFEDHLKMPIISIPLANEDSNMHGVDENLSEQKMKEGLEFSAKLLAN